MYNRDLFRQPHEQLISYGKAKHRQDKTGSHFITSVKWSKAAENNSCRTTIKFNTIGERKILLYPKLPKGYEMETHPSWIELVNDIYNKNKASTYDFDYLESVEADLEILYDLNICQWDVIDYDNHEEYMARFRQYEESWDEFWLLFKNLHKTVINQPQHVRGQKMERRSPPQIVEVLEEMLRLAKEDACAGENLEEVLHLARKSLGAGGGQ